MGTDEKYQTISSNIIHGIVNDGIRFENFQHKPIELGKIVDKNKCKGN